MSNPLSSRCRVAGFVVVLAALTACAPDTDGTADTTIPGSTIPEPTLPAGAVVPNGESVTVQALDNSFRSNIIEISAGTQVTFDNRGRNQHDVLPADASQDWGVQAIGFQPGDTYTYVFTTPGEFHYFCSIHGTAEVGMTGTIIVSA